MMIKLNILFLLYYKNFICPMSSLILVGEKKNVILCSQLILKY